MVMSVLLRLIYPPAPSLYIKVMSGISFASLASGGMAEIRGEHMQYSKFWRVEEVGNNSQQSSSSSSCDDDDDDDDDDELLLLSAKNKNKVDSKTGMLMAYSPAFLALVAALAILPTEEASFRFLLVISALTIHFFKRIFEVLFVHKYNGGMFLHTVIQISVSYLINTITMVYSQYISQELLEPQVDLKYAGIWMFLIGISGNFYHHLLLSKMRDQKKVDDKEYKIPKGGMFNLVTCPHYLFEILGFVGVSCISQTIFACSYTLGTAIYLMGRSYATREWYISKFEEFPKDVKALIPFVF